MSEQSQIPPSISDEDLELLGALPLFEALAEDLSDLLGPRLEFRDFEAGERLIEQELRADSVVFLLKGEVAVNRDGKLVTLVPAPEVLGLVSILDHQPRTATLEAFSPVRVGIMSSGAFEAMLEESTALNRNLLAHLASKLRRQYGFSDQVQRHFDDFFRSPNAELVPGPYTADPFEMLVFSMEETPERLEALLPPGLRPMPGMGGRYLLSFNFFESVRSEDPFAEGRTFSYNETAIFIPCLGPNLRPGLFIPELYPDNFLAITLGREIYGFPKRFARTRRDSNRRTIDLVIARRVTLRATWSEETDTDFSDLIGRQIGQSWQRWIPPLAKSIGDRIVGWFEQKVRVDLNPVVPIYVRKKSLSGGDAEVVDELVKIPFRVLEPKDFADLGDAEVRFLDPDYFLAGHCRGGFRLRMGLSFDDREVLRRYAPEQSTEEA
jgi:hypothetical protein